METDSIRTDYYGCVYFYKTFINQSKNVSPPDLNISGIESYNRKGGQKKRKGGSGGAVEDMYYSKEEYKTLSPDQILALYKKRQVRGHKPTKNKVKFKGGGATYKPRRGMS